MKQTMEAQRDSRVSPRGSPWTSSKPWARQSSISGSSAPMAPCCCAKGGAPSRCSSHCSWLRRENLNRGHIYVRPAGIHGLSLVDDLKAEALAQMKAGGV